MREGTREGVRGVGVQVVVEGEVVVGVVVGVEEVVVGAGEVITVNAV